MAQIFPKLRPSSLLLDSSQETPTLPTTMANNQAAASVRDSSIRPSAGQTSTNPFAQLLLESTLLTNHILPPAPGVSGLLLSSSSGPSHNGTAGVWSGPSSLGGPSDNMLTMDGGGGGIIGPLDLTNIHTASAGLLRRQQTATAVADSKESISTPSGLSAKQHHLIDSLTLSYAPLAAIGDTDLSGFLSNQSKNILAITIEEGRAAIQQQYQTTQKNRHFGHWRAIRNRCVSGGASVPPSAVGASSRGGGMTGSLSGSGGSTAASAIRLATPQQKAQVDSLTAAKLNVYIEHLQRFAQYRLAVESAADTTKNQSQTTKFPFFRNIVELLHQRLPSDPSTTILSSLWQLLASCVQDPDRGALAWLETNFRGHVDQVVTSHHLAVGGRPTLHDAIDAFIQFKFSANGRWNFSWLDFSLDSGSPFWAHLYILVRGGYIHEAFDYLGAYADAMLNTPDRHFITWFKAWMENDFTLPATHLASLMGVWNTSVCEFYPSDYRSAGISGDLFKWVLYKMLGKITGGRVVVPKEIMTTTEDYMWLQLHLVTPAASAPPSDSLMSARGRGASTSILTMSQLQEKIKSFGKAHFKGLNWFMVCSLVGLWELGLDDLCTEFPLDALMFAIGLSYNKKLRVPENPEVAPMGGSLLIPSHDAVPGGRDALCISKMILSVVTRLTSTLDVALPFLVVLGMLGGKYAQFGKDIICNLLITIPDWELYIGKMERADSTSVMEGGSGVASKGKLEKWMPLLDVPTDRFKDEVLAHCGDLLIADNQYEKAIPYYHIAQNYSKVIEILITETAARIAREDFAVSGMSGMVAFQELHQYYVTQPSIVSLISPLVLHTFESLLSIYAGLEAGVNQRDLECLDIFMHMGLLPESSRDMMAIQKKVDDFALLAPPIAATLPAILACVMGALSRVYLRTRNPEYKDVSKAIVLFAGNLQFRIPGEVVAKINTFDALLQ